MKRIIVFAILAVLAVVCAAFASGTEEAVSDPGQTVSFGPAGTLFPAVPPDAKKAPVGFSHAAHGDMACVTCHHTAKGEPSGTDGIFILDKDGTMSCSQAGCHDDFKDKKGTRSYYRAFHSKDSAKSCVGCHKAAKADGASPEAPVSCKGCHVK